MEKNLCSFNGDHRSWQEKNHIVRFGLDHRKQVISKRSLLLAMNRLVMELILFYMRAQSLPQLSHCSCRDMWDMVFWCFVPSPPLGVWGWKEEAAVTFVLLPIFQGLCQERTASSNGLHHIIRNI